jgi:hypothetical protein
MHDAQRFVSEYGRSKLQQILRDAVTVTSAVVEKTDGRTGARSSATVTATRYHNRNRHIPLQLKTPSELARILCRYKNEVVCLFGQGGVNYILIMINTWALLKLAPCFRTKPRMGCIQKSLANTCLYSRNLSYGRRNLLHLGRNGPPRKVTDRK